MTLPGSDDRAAGASAVCLTDDGWRGTTSSNGAAGGAGTGAAGASGGCLTDDGWRGTTTSNGAAGSAALAYGRRWGSFAPLPRTLIDTGSDLKL